MKRIPEETRIQQINDLPNISFVRWISTYQNQKSRVLCRCAVDGCEWSTSVVELIHYKTGCPKCGVARRSDKRRIPKEERERQINALPNICFVRWPNGYANKDSKAQVMCMVDGVEWAATVGSLLNQGTGCPKCSAANMSGRFRTPAAAREAQINKIKNVAFVRWEGPYKNHNSKAVCRCAVDGHEWSASVSNLLSQGTRCPRCADYGFNPTKRGTLYLLRSDCGSMVKIGISNTYKTRHEKLKKNTPFSWACICMIHGAGEAVAKAEKELHSRTEQCVFTERFDGFTEWRKWDKRIPDWLEEFRFEIEAP